MGSIGPDPAELLIEGSLFVLLIAIIGGWGLYQYRIIRLLLCIVAFLLSSTVLGYIFFHPSPYNLNQHGNLFFTSLCYAFSACYLTKRHFITPVIWLASVAYLLVASLLTLQAVFNMTYEEKIAEKLMTLSVDIAIYLYVPISVMIILWRYSRVNIRQNK